MTSPAPFPFTSPDRFPPPPGLPGTAEQAAAVAGLAFPAVPGAAWPGQATPGVPGLAAAPQPAPGGAIPFPAIPAQAVPGNFAPGNPGQPPPRTAAVYVTGEQAFAAGASATTWLIGNASPAGAASAVILSSPSAAPVSVTDTQGNTYALAASDAAGNQPTWIYLAQDCAALTAADSVTATWNSTAGTKNCLSLAAPGAALSGALDQAASADGGTAAPSVTTGATAVPGEIVIAALSWPAAGGWAEWASPAAGAAQTGLAGAPQTAAAAYTAAAAGAQTVSASLEASAAWTAAAVTLRPASPLKVIQAVAGGTSGEYGIASTKITTTEGSLLMVFAGWALDPASDTATVPACYVADSAGNDWVHLATSSASGAGARCSIWACANAKAVTWVCPSLTSFASTSAWTVIEFTGAPQVVSPDAQATGWQPSGTSLTVSAAGAKAGDLAFGVLAVGGSGNGIIEETPAGWTALAASAIPAGPGGNRAAVFPAMITGVADGTVSASWLHGPSAPAAAAIAVLSAAPAVPAQTSPDYPLLQVEAGFGFVPGVPSSAPPAWTDITARCIAGNSSPLIAWSYGRAYELSQAEAGTLTVAVDNHDGAFTPGNTASPYYPDVAIATPVRVRAWWDSSGRWEPVAYGYVERWPQEWPDLPQWGLSKMTCADAVAVMASTDMPSALAGEMLLDAPYALFPMGEQYFTFSNGISAFGTLGSYTQSEAAGLPALNASRVNQMPGTYVDGSASQLQTGQAMNLLGDAGTGIGGSPADTANSGPGMVYADPSMPSPATGCSLEMWVVASAIPADGITLLPALGDPSPYGLFQFALSAVSGTLVVSLPGNPLWQSVPFTASAAAQQIAVTITAPPKQVLAVYVNGALAGSWDLPSYAAVTWQSLTAGCARGPWGLQPSCGTYAASYLGIWDYPLAESRIYAHWRGGADGFSGVGFAERVAQILSWGYLGLPKAAPPPDPGAPQAGPAYSLAGSNAADAVNTAAAGDGGMISAMPSGALTAIPLRSTYRLPATAAFGDSITAAQTPSSQNQAFGYDNTYIYNVSTSTRVDGPTQGISVTVKDFASQQSYFTRSALAQTTETTSDYDARDQANWGLAAYAQPALRAQRIEVKAAANPSVFPVVLATRAGDVVTVSRNPVGGAPISLTGVVEKVSGRAGPSQFDVSYQVSPYPAAAQDAYILDSGAQAGSSALPR